MIIGLIGKKGSGKTLLMTALTYNHFINDYIIYANYHLMYNYTNIDNTNFEKLISNENRKNVIAIDELVPQTKIRNINCISFEIIISQLRKYITEEGFMYYTVQFEHQIPPDILMHTDFLIRCYTFRANNNIDYISTVYSIFMNRNLIPIIERLAEKPEFNYIGSDSKDLTAFFGLYERYQILKQIGKDYDSIINKYIFETHLKTKGKLMAELLLKQDAQSKNEASIISEMIINKRNKLSSENPEMINPNSILNFT